MDRYEDVIKALENKLYKVSFFKTYKDALLYLDTEIDGYTVGFGDSQTMKKMGLFETLVRHNVVYDPLQSKDNNEFLEIATKCLTTEVFLTSVNGMSRKGEMVNIDGTGNRVAGSLFGHKKVYFVVSTNKIADDLEGAIYRARNVAAPKNAMKFPLKTPCVMTKGEKCFDCQSPDRICNAVVLYLRKMNDIEDVEVVLIDEEMGY